MKNKKIGVNSKLEAIGQLVGLTAIDVGARGGVNFDLLPMATAVDFIGFEPDTSECAALNQKQIDAPWKSSRYLPYALSDADKDLTLNLYSKAGCTSCYEALPERGALFAREDYYHEIGQEQIPSVRLDHLVDRQELKAPDFMKIDVQGMEIEVFEGAGQLLRTNTVAIRTEVCFFELYKNQPLFADIDAYLRQRNFVAMNFLEMHSWRRLTKSNKAFVKNCKISHSKGQLMHADVLYLQHPEQMSCQSEADVIRLVRLALIAACYEHYDLSFSIFKKKEVIDFCNEKKFDASGGILSIAKSRNQGKRKLASYLRNLAGRLDKMV